ncbi:Hypothetical predicted protein [Paramuricea clavata]|uniref:Uncharacterized protein n=1 Tax=Paramuricea clavata TaxID=317549 RepID=A0A6S7FWE3_PARCT|nr:Hypothetical predicted protein [Paramuricea clavata]
MDKKLKCEVEWDRLSVLFEEKRAKDLIIMRNSDAFLSFQQKLGDGYLTSWQLWPELIEPLERNKLDISHYLYTAEKLGTSGEQPILDEFIKFLHVTCRCGVETEILEKARKIVYSPTPWKGNVVAMKSKKQSGGNFNGKKHQRSKKQDGGIWGIILDHELSKRTKYKSQNPYKPKKQRGAGGAGFNWETLKQLPRVYRKVKGKKKR